MHRLIVVAVLLVGCGLIIGGCGGGGGSDAPGDSEALLPLAVGNQWRYDYTEYDLTGTAAKRAGISVLARGHRPLGTRALNAEDIVTVSGSETLGGREWFSIVARYVGGEAEPAIYLRHGSQGLQRKDTATDPAYYMIHHPIAVGTTWDVPFTSDGVGYIETFTIRAVDEVISVPAGTYSNCVMIDNVFKEAGHPDDVITYWYAPNVGEVKEEQHIGNELSYELSLLEYTPAGSE